MRTGWVYWVSLSHWGMIEIDEGDFSQANFRRLAIKRMVAEGQRLGLP